MLVGLGDRKGAIGGAIIPDKQFKVPIGLGQDAGDRLPRYASRL